MKTRSSAGVVVRRKAEDECLCATIDYDQLETVFKHLRGILTPAVARVNRITAFRHKQ